MNGKIHLISTGHFQTVKCTRLPEGIIVLECFITNQTVGMMGMALSNLGGSFGEPKLMQVGHFFNKETAVVWGATIVR